MTESQNHSATQATNNTSTKAGNPSIRLALFAGSCFALPTIGMLKSLENAENPASVKIVGVILPDPNELGALGTEVVTLATQLNQAQIPFLYCNQENLPKLVNQLDQWQANLGVLANFSHLIPKTLLDYFPLGIYNLHASKLPSYPGPMPIYWQLRNRETETAIVLHRAEPSADSGNIVVERKLSIHPLDTMHSLSNIAAFEASQAVKTLLEMVKDEEKPITGQAQSPPPTVKESDFPGIHYARRLNQNDCLIDCENQTATDISAQCRAGNHPAYAPVLLIKNTPIQVLQASDVDVSTYGTPPGTILLIGEPEGLIIGVKNSALRLDVLSCSDGIYSGLAFAERFQLEAGSQVSSAPATNLQD